MKGSKGQATNGPLSPSPNAHILPTWLAPSFLSTEEAEEIRAELPEELPAGRSSIPRHMSLVLQDLGVLATLTFRQQTCHNMILSQETERLPFYLAPTPCLQSMP